VGHDPIQHSTTGSSATTKQTNKNDQSIKNGNVHLYSTTTALVVTDRAGVQPMPQLKPALTDFGHKQYSGT